METISPEWKKFGLLMPWTLTQLDKKLGTLKQSMLTSRVCSQANGQDICCQELFTVWLDGADATWGNLIELLVDSEQGELAKQVRDALGL